jgi:hypothetical protein
MKVISILLCLTAALLAGCAIASAQKEQLPGESRHEAKVLRLGGEVIATDVRNGQRKLHAGDSVRPNDLLKTGLNSFIDLKLQGTFLRITPDTQVGIDRIAKQNGNLDIQLDLRRGRIICAIEELTASSKYEVKTSVGICGARADNTVFDVTDRGRLRCGSGTVVAVFIISGRPIPALTIHSQQMCAPPTQPDSTLISNIDDESFRYFLNEIQDLRSSRTRKMD